MTIRATGEAVDGIYPELAWLQLGVFVQCKPGAVLHPDYRTGDSQDVGDCIGHVIRAETKDVWPAIRLPGRGDYIITDTEYDLVEPFDPIHQEETP